VLQVDARKGTTMTALGDELVRYREAAEWKPLGACYGMDPMIFFPDMRDDFINWKNPRTLKLVSEARKICQKCPVAMKCLYMALDAGSDSDPAGIFCGTTPKQRKRMRLEWRAKGLIP
jgi:WhiB family redox-sensing transcriptional regulator